MAATKSVVEQALIYDSLIVHLAKNQSKQVDFNKLEIDIDHPVKTSKVGNPYTG